MQYVIKLYDHNYKYNGPKPVWFKTQPTLGKHTTQPGGSWNGGRGFEQLYNRYLLINIFYRDIENFW